ncbi:DUF4260 family protein [Fulvivirgaceae bacterium PWU4]|uniref:DUF4260 family protein n=1 Tax=Chryseosolibacter histidini TaxID=2782349 RepID=A0AAP2GLB5_9BACT|nr:DUF4260 domain-containing protein [Chryseosolibacter histidini]MBT1700221.1 DUF4260 family protein [Chryseosolibacter histidini]
MKTILKLEEALQLIFAAYLSTLLPFAWWWYWVLFLTPDVSMIGYVLNTRVGAFTYNLFHHKGVALAIYIFGIALNFHEVQFVGLLLFGHSAFDRLLGYGLKYADSFQNTHLGRIGKA